VDIKESSWVRIQKVLPNADPAITYIWGKKQRIQMEDNKKKNKKNIVFDVSELPNVPSPHVMTIPLSLAKTEKPCPAPTLVIDFVFNVSTHVGVERQVSRTP
jgi:hypothetical protein